MPEARVSEGVQHPHEPRREERATELLLAVADARRRAAPVVPPQVGEVPLRVVVLHEPLVGPRELGTIFLAAASGSLPGEALALANEALFARIPPNMFVTCFYAILDPKNATLTYANAGHDLPYLHRKGDAEELRARGMPLGLMPGMSYDEGEVSLAEGDCVLFHSDGLVEAHNPIGLRQHCRGTYFSCHLQDFTEWRDPDSNRGHHDFQSFAKALRYAENSYR